MLANTLAKSSGHRIGKRSWRLDSRSVGSTWSRRTMAFCASPNGWAAMVAAFVS